MISVFHTNQLIYYRAAAVTCSDTRVLEHSGPIMRVLVGTAEQGENPPTSEVISTSSEATGV